MSYDEIIAHAINTYILDKVWNEPYSEFRENIQPILLNDKSCIGNFISIYGTVLPLPTKTSAYYVYGLSNIDMHIDINIPVNTWIDTATIANTYHTLFHLYTLKGIMCCKSYVYLRYSSDRQFIYIAIDKRMLKKIDKTSSIKDIYFTIYYDSDQPNPITIDSFRIATDNSDYTYTIRINNFLTDVSDIQHFTLFVNGKEYSNGSYIPQYNDYIDLINDKNIIGTFTVDLTDIDYGKVYNSTMDNCYKYVIHIPKALNPTNKVITHNTCDMYVIGNEKVNGAHIGLYLHRCANISVGQITHNDFSVPLHIVDAFRDHLQQQNVSIKVLLRQHDKNNTLIRDKNYIDLLYTHDDRDIVQFLTGNKLQYPQLSFWNAQELEKSTYVKYLLDAPENITNQFITEYTEGLGYYHMVSLICERVIYNTITPSFTGSLSLTKPYLYRGYKLEPIVYLNGRKILRDYISITYEDDQFITIQLTDNVPYTVGDIMTIVLYLDGNKKIYSHTPTITNPYINIDFDKIQVYEVTSQYTQYKGLQHSSNTLYTLVKPNYGYYVTLPNNDGTTQVLFSEVCYGKKYIIISEYNTYYFNLDIDAIVSTGGNIVFNLEYKDVTETEIHPILNIKNSSVYLNGRYLIKDLGYRIIPVTNKENTGISFVQFILQGFDHLLDSGNRLEIYLHMAEEEDRSYHFVRENIVTDHTPINIWFPTLTCCHVNGLLETNVQDYGRYIQLPLGKYNNGDAFEVQTAIPKIINDFLKKYHDNDDKARLVLLNEYFGKNTIELPSLILLPQNYRIYSVFLNYIIRKILFEGFIFIDDPDDFRRTHQLEEYKYLMDFDIVYTINEKVMEYIDYYPSYQQYTGTIEQYAMIRKLIEAYAPKDKILSGGDYHG